MHEPEREKITNLDALPIPARHLLDNQGSDPSGGAGIQADLKTFAAFGVYGASVLTALTAQNTRGVSGVFPVPPSFVRAQAEAVLSGLAVGAIKVGMLGDAATIEVVARLLRVRREFPVGLDPVMVAASGDPLLAAEAVGVLRELLLPLATLVTPNAHEAALLLGESVASDEEGLALQAARLRVHGPAAALVKGGRLGGQHATDALATRTGGELLTAPRVALERPHARTAPAARSPRRSRRGSRSACRCSTP